MVAIGPRKDQNAELHSLKNIIRKQDKKIDHGSHGLTQMGKNGNKYGIHPVPVFKIRSYP
jgi:hypothetical protein